MIKMKFQEGGQPVYLDDLSVIQSASADALDKFLSSLGGDISKDILFLSKPTVSYSGNSISTTSGILWVKDKGFITLPAVNGLDISATGSAYVQIISTDIESRVFSDAQTRACQQQITAQLIATQTGTYYKFDDISEFIPSLAALVDIANKTDYIRLSSITWANGYTGTIEYKNIYGGKRYHIKASSANATWTTPGLIFTAALPESVSLMFLTGGDDPSVDKPHYIYTLGNGQCYLVSSIGSLESNPELCPIDITFDSIGTPFI
jgi:hypothetical protein